MTGTDFLRLLEQPRLLYELPTSELQQLAVRFPYSSNLRLLLLLKVHLEGHPDEATYLARCAAATFDRASVYDALKEIDALPEEGVEMDGDVLELKELDDLMLDVLPEQVDEQAPLAEELPQPVSEFVSGWEEESLSAEEADADVWDHMLAQAENEEDVNPEGDPQPVEEEALPSASLPSQEQPVSPGYGTLQERLARIRERQRTTGFNEKEDVNRIARRSLVAQEEVASETLAKLLIKQGQYQNAIKMYQRLILLYPEKKTTFAGLIKELKEKL